MCQLSSCPPNPPLASDLEYLKLMSKETSAMNKDNAYAFASFIAQGGYNYKGENFNSVRIFGSVDDALDYARDLLDHGYDYVYVTGVNADGSLDLKDVIRTAEEEPSSVDLG